MDDSASSCVFIASEKSQITDEYGILNINVFPFERNGDTAGGCLPEMNITDYFIDAITFQDRMTPEIVVVNITKGQSIIMVRLKHGLMCKTHTEGHALAYSKYVTIASCHL